MIDVVESRQAEWRHAAACRPAGIPLRVFFPERGQDAATARAVCSGCTVRSECLAEGVGQRVGVWGGMTEHERRGRAAA